MTDRFDVVVVGAGPAGATAARVAAEGGARVLLLDGARFPRYKTCGGGLIGTSLAELPPAALAVVERRVRTVSIARSGGAARRIRTRSPFLAMVSRTALDAALVDAAVAAGVEFRDHVRVRELSDEADGAVLRLGEGEGEVRGSVVVGADGSAGVTGRFVGVRIARADLGLELEITNDDPGWADRVHLDWGSTPGSYGWVFPKDGRLSVGVVQRKGDGAGTRAYLDRFVAAVGATGPVERSSGHLIQWRARDSPLRRGRVLVAGDAAGLVEPWTREGISFALRSGRLAGEAAAAAVRSADAKAALGAYEQAVERLLEPEQRAGAALLRLFERWPAAVHLVVTRTGIGATAFVRFCRGSLSLERVLRHGGLGPVLRLLAR